MSFQNLLLNDKIFKKFFVQLFNTFLGLSFNSKSL